MNRVAKCLSVVRSTSTHFAVNPFQPSIVYLANIIILLIPRLLPQCNSFAFQVTLIGQKSSTIREKPMWREVLLMPRSVRPLCLPVLAVVAILVSSSSFWLIYTCLSSLAKNLKLRAAISKAKAINMPKDNIERLLKRGAAKDAMALSEITYEAHGPGGVALIIETKTDNKNRTVAQIRHVLKEGGGMLVHFLSIDRIRHFGDLWKCPMVFQDHGPHRCIYCQCKRSDYAA